MTEPIRESTAQCSLADCPIRWRLEKLGRRRREIDTQSAFSRWKSAVHIPLAACRAMMTTHDADATHRAREHYRRSRSGQAVMRQAFFAWDLHLRRRSDHFDTQTQLLARQLLRAWRVYTREARGTVSSFDSSVSCDAFAVPEVCGVRRQLNMCDPTTAPVVYTF